jgi:hypothetical protein
MSCLHLNHASLFLILSSHPCSEGLDLCCVATNLAASSAICVPLRRIEEMLARIRLD